VVTATLFNNTMDMNIAHLPLDVLHSVFLLLSGDELLLVAQVCRSLNYAAGIPILALTLRLSH
jgi:hypothetical protein